MDNKKKMKKLKKGCLVRLNVSKCFTSKQGGGLRYPMSNYLNDDKGTVESQRPTTPEEQANWRKELRQEIEDAVVAGKDTWHISMDSAGESRLPPQSRYVPIHRDRTYQVLRARCRVRLGWGNPTPGLTKILCTVTGEEAYIKRDLLEVI
jgi:hypothetical protein